METVFAGAWSGDSCTRSAIGTLLLIGAVLTGTLLLIAAISWGAMRRMEDRAAARRLLVWICGSTAAVCLGIGVYVVFFGGPVYRHIAFGGGILVFEGCSGFRPVREDIPFAEVEGVHYRSRWSGGRSRYLIDEVVVATRGRGPFLIPLNTDPSLSRHEALIRLLPKAVIDDYVASLRSRNITPPPALAGR